MQATEKLTIPMPADDYQVIREKAAREGISMAEYGRRCLGVKSNESDEPAPADQPDADKETPVAQPQ